MADQYDVVPVTGGGVVSNPVRAGKQVFTGDDEWLAHPPGWVKPSPQTLEYTYREFLRAMDTPFTTTIRPGPAPSTYTTPTRWVSGSSTPMTWGYSTTNTTAGTSPYYPGVVTAETDRYFYDAERRQYERTRDQLREMMERDRQRREGDRQLRNQMEAEEAEAAMRQRLAARRMAGEATTPPRLIRRMFNGPGRR